MKEPTNKRRDYTMIGSFLPNDDSALFAAYCLSKQISKAKFVRQCVYTALNSTDEATVLMDIVHFIDTQWKTKQSKHPMASYDEFVKQIAIDLEGKGLTSRQVKLIIGSLKQR